MIFSRRLNGEDSRMLNHAGPQIPSHRPKGALARLAMCSPPWSTAPVMGSSGVYVCADIARQTRATAIPTAMIQIARLMSTTAITQSHTSPTAPPTAGSR